MKHCSKCEQTKPVDEFHVRERDPSGKPFRWQSWCKSCQRKATRRRAGLKRRGKAYKARGPRLTPEQTRERQRQRYHEKKKDPEWLAMRRADQRIRAADARRAAGAQQRSPYTISTDGYNHHARDFVDSAPFIAWLKEHRIAVNELARLMGVDRKRIQVFVNDDPPQHVTLGFVDRAMHAVGQDGEMWTLYPD